MSTALRHDLSVVMMPLEDLRPWAHNPRINDEAAERLARTIGEVGWTNPILLDREGTIIAGHTRAKAAARLGLTEVPTVTLDVVGSEARMIALADNRLGELAQWDNEGLAAILQDLKAEDHDLEVAGFTDEDLDALLASLDPDVMGPEDVAPEAAPEAAQSEVGGVYELGPHRLVCGDSCGGGIAVVLQGEEADLVWTDPPYGVSYVGGTAEALTIENDSLSEEELTDFLKEAFASALAGCRPGAPWYVTGPSGRLQIVFITALDELGIWHQTLIWEKDSLVLGHSDYHYRHEPMFYGWAPGAAHPWIGGRKQTSIHQCARPRRNKEHPTMKPVELIERCLQNHIRKGVVLDPFGGSGSTLIACARLGLSARLVELDPRYCDVIRRRWTEWALEAGVDPGPGRLDA